MMKCGYTENLATIKAGEASVKVDESFTLYAASLPQKLLFKSIIQYFLD